MKLTGDHCLCSGSPYKGCGEHFNSTFSFDAHRVGTYTPDTRRCLTPQEMRDKGMKLTANGWRIIGG
jgi:hypothetical protein